MLEALTDDKSTLVQVMAWCRQATSHYVNQCWPRSPTPYGVTRPQWGQVMHICFSNLTIIGSDDGLLPGGCQAIVNRNCNIFIKETAFECIICKVASILPRPPCIIVPFLNIYRPMNVFITMPADALAPNGARPSAGTVLTDRCISFLPNPSGYPWLCITSGGQMTSFNKW